MPSPDDALSANTPLARQTSNNSSKDASKLKRGRETSLEPSATEATEATPVLTGTTKKNRLELEDPEARTVTPIPESGSSETLKSPQKEGRNVGEVRKKVERMSYTEDMETEGAAKEEGEGNDDSWETIDKAEAAGSVENVAPPGSVENAGDVQEEGVKDLKRKTFERSESSFSTAEGAKRTKETPSVSYNSVDQPAATQLILQPPPGEAVEPQKKPQASFSSFTSSASPFAARPSTSAPPVAASSDKPKPSPFASASTSAKPFSSSGFMGFSGSASPFAAKKSSAFGSTTAPVAVSSKSEENGNNEVDEDNEAGPSKSSFGDILATTGHDDASEGTKVHMTEQDVVTGEEDESTMYQTRTKLYVMQADGGWRERGVGLLRLNVRRSDGQAPRLVMRAEGVLRLILNVSLYVGMTCLEDGKHVRMTVFEDGERKFVTFRTGSLKAAQELAVNIHEHIPLEGKSAETSKSPDPAV